MNLTLTSVMQKLMNLVDKFDRGDCDENKGRKISAPTKELTRADFLSSDYVNYVASNFVRNSAKNVSNHLTLDVKRAFNQLRQAFTEASIL